MVQQTALQKTSDEVISMMRGVVEVTVDENGDQTVVKTGFRYPADVDFAEGDYDNKGNFVPRYWGWGGRMDGKEFDGHLFDSNTSREIRPLNPLPKQATVIPFHKSPYDRMEELREQARELRAGAGIV